MDQTLLIVFTVIFIGMCAYTFYLRDKIIALEKELDWNKRKIVELYTTGGEIMKHHHEENEVADQMIKELAKMYSDLIENKQKPEE